MLNIERTKKVMARTDADWIIATTPENVFYSSGFRSLGQWLMRSSKIELFVLIPRADPRNSILIAPAQELDVAAAIPPRVSQIHPVGHTTIELGDRALWQEQDKRIAEWIFETPSHETIYAAVETLNLIQPGQRVVLDDELTFPGLQAILPEGAELVVAPDVLQDIRVIKTEEELALLREGVRIAENGLRASLAALRTGVSERELAHVYDMVLTEAGAIPYMTIVGIGSNGASPNHPPTDRRLRPHELIRWDVGCEVEGYRVDLGFVAFYGEPTPKVVRYMDAIVRGQTACLEGIRPNNTLAEVYQVGFDIMKEVIPSYNRKHLGHGVGVELREPPIIAPADAHEERGVFFERARNASAGIIEPGMVIALEVLYYELGVGGFQIEDTVIVTENGAERVNELPYELICIPLSE